LRTTNPIENLNGLDCVLLAQRQAWKDGQIALRWVAGALSDAKGRFRKLRGYRDMKLLLASRARKRV
jgi:putative transposase